MFTSKLTPHLWKLSYFCPFIRSFHFPNGKNSCYYVSPYRGSHLILLLILIIIFLPPFFKMTGIGKLTTYPNDIWYQVSVRQKLFKNHRTTLNPTPLQSYLPFYEKPCYRSPEETVRDIDTKSFGHCSLTKGATLLHLSRKNSRTSYKSYLPLNSWCKS